MIRSDCVIDDREMIVEAVLQGILGAEHITEDELFELEDAVFEAVASKHTLFDTWETLQ